VSVRRASSVWSVQLVRLQPQSSVGWPIAEGADFGLNLGLLTSLISFIGLWLFGHDLSALIVGVIFLDAGVQASQVSNQTKIYSLLPEAPSRVNTVYMTSFLVAVHLAPASVPMDGAACNGKAYVLLALECCSLPYRCIFAAVRKSRSSTPARGTFTP